MKILLTFEDPSVSIHFLDVVRMLKHFGHDIYFYNAGKRPFDPFYLTYFKNSMYFLNTLYNTDQYDMWIYDLTSWYCPKSVLIEKLESYKGPMICICEGDGADFCLHRSTDKIIEKTDLFMRNTLFTNLERYDARIRNKLFLSTCYISNSQDFKTTKVPFKKKKQRTIFTGSLTGFSEKGNPDERLCRIKVPMALIAAGVPCVYRVHGFEPSLKKEFDELVPKEYLTSVTLSRDDFVKEMSNSMIILAMRGNYHTVNRFFEGQASGGIVFATKFRDQADFYGHGEPNVHYVEIEWDGSDVVEKTKYYFDHLAESEMIARNGRKLWEDYSMLDENGTLPLRVLNYYVAGIKKFTGIDISRI